MIDKISHFCADFSQNFESVCEHTVEKFCEKDAKKGNFSNRMGFRKKSKLKISCYNQQRDLKISSVWVKKTVRRALEFHGVKTEEIAIHLITDRAMRKMHDRFFQDPSPTDCISFPYDETFLGEVFVCPKIALEYVALNGGDPYNEVMLYIVHGILHLIGYDDIEKQDRSIMRAKEKELMGYLAT